MWNDSAGTTQLSGQTGKNLLPHHESYVKSSLALNSQQILCSKFPKLSFGTLKVILTPFLEYRNCYKSAMLILVNKVSKFVEYFLSIFWWFLKQFLYYLTADEHISILFHMYSKKLSLILKYRNLSITRGSYIYF